MKIKGAVAGVDGHWESLGADPYFEFTLWPLKPAFLIFAVASEAATVNTQIYFDMGDGYNERDSLSVELNRDVVVCIPLRVIKGSRIRIDPVSKAGRFYFVKTMVWRDSSLLTGVKSFRDRHDLAASISVRRLSPDDILFRDTPLLRDFDTWVRPARDDLVNEKLLAVDIPLISFVVPVYNAKASYLDQLIASIFDGQFGCIELVLSDDGSTSSETAAAIASAADMNNNIKVSYSTNTGYGGAVNRGVNKALGTWVAIIDHDDYLTAGAIGHLLAALSRFQDAKMFYTDELVAGNRGKIVDMMAKPVFDPVLLSGVNYINHLSVYDRSRFIAVGGMRSGFRGSQDYDLVLRYTDGLLPHEIVHVPFPAYTWRREGATFSKTYLEECTTSARQALAEHYSVIGKISVVPALLQDYHKLAVIEPVSGWPSVSVIIVANCKGKAGREAIELLETGTDYNVAELVICSLDGTDDDLRNAAGNASIPTTLIDGMAFDPCVAVSASISNSQNSWIAILTEAIRPVDSNWLRELVSCTYFRRTGLVAPRCVDLDGRIINSGMVYDSSGNLVEWFKRQSLELAGGLGMLQLRHTVSAVSSQCVLLSRECFEAIGSPPINSINKWSEECCEKAARAGYRTVWTPETTIILSTEEMGEPRVADASGAHSEALNSNGCNDLHASPWYNLLHGLPLIAIDNIVPEGRTNTSRCV